MVTTERRQQPQRVMAWRAATDDRVRRATAHGAVLLLTLLLALLTGATVVAAIRRQSGWTSPLVPLLGIAISCAAGLIYSVDSRQRVPAFPALRISHTVRPGIVAAVAVAVSLAAAMLTINIERPALAAVIWLLALALLLGHALYLERPILHPPTPIDAVALIGLVALAALLRLPHLADLPAFVHSDEAQMALHTQMALHGEMPTLFGTTDWWSVPWLGPAMEAPLMLVLGQGLTAVRLASVLAALLATAGLWFLGSELWSRRAGFVAALLFAVLAPSIHFGRDGVHYMQSIAALVWTVLAYTRATKRYSGAYAALTGILMGVDVQLYYAARLAVPLVFLHAGIRAMLERGLLRNWLRILLWTALGLIVAFLPMGAYYAQHTAAIAQRTDVVLIFSPTAPARGAVAHDYGRAGWLEILGRQTQRVVLGFLAIGDRSEQYGAATPLLDPVSAALLPAACALALARIRESAWLLCALWAAITVILGGLLTTYQPDAPRLLAAMPAVCLLIGGLAHVLLATAGESGLRDAKPLLAIGLAIALVAAAITNVNEYFDGYPARAATRPITVITDLARYLHTVPASEPVVLYNHHEFYLAHWTIQILAPQVQGSSVSTLGDLRATLATLHGPFLLLAVDEDWATLRTIYAKYPGGRLVRVAVHDPRHLVLTYAYPGPHRPYFKAAAGFTGVL